MIESSAYELIDEWRAQARVDVLLRQGRRKFGSPPAVVEKTLRALTDLERLDRMTDVILTAGSWDELLATP